MKELTFKQRTIVCLAIWPVVFLALWLNCAMFGWDFRWCTTAIYAGVIGIALYFSI